MIKQYVHDEVPCTRGHKCSRTRLIRSVSVRKPLYFVAYYIIYLRADTSELILGRLVWVLFRSNDFRLHPLPEKRCLSRTRIIIYHISYEIKCTLVSVPHRPPRSRAICFNGPWLRGKRHCAVSKLCVQTAFSRRKPDLCRSYGRKLPSKSKKTF